MNRKVLCKAARMALIRRAARKQRRIIGMYYEPIKPDSLKDVVGSFTAMPTGPLNRALITL